MKFLFERLTQPGVRAADFDLKRAVRDNAQRLLGNRVPVGIQAEIDVLSCGLPSVVEISRDSRGQVEKYAARAQRLLERYEPRLMHARVEPVAADDAPYRLVVSATLKGADGIEDMRFPVLAEGESP